ncbi:hypothetical protein TNCV_562851 [Trichonephila clavipes]|nr:hypothetical protein TNCV_562851 [Trichonephila clavipes]
MEIAGDLFSTVDKDPSQQQHSRIATRDEKWCFLFDPQSKRALATWKSSQSPYKQTRNLRVRSLVTYPLDKNDHLCLVAVTGLSRYRYTTFRPIHCEQRALYRYPTSFVRIDPKEEIKIMAMILPSNASASPGQ